MNKILSKLGNPEKKGESYIVGIGYIAIGGAIIYICTTLETLWWSISYGCVAAIMVIFGICIILNMIRSK